MVNDLNRVANTHPDCQVCPEPDSTISASKAMYSCTGRLVRPPGFESLVTTLLFTTLDHSKPLNPAGAESIGPILSVEDCMVC